jgi:acetylornithine deacetylase/succinyl-diaminopimelate desuccinylase-like protein
MENPRRFPIVGRIGSLYRRFAVPGVMLAVATVMIGAVPTPVAGEGASSRTRYQRMAREALEELVEIDTTDAAGNTTEAAEAMAARLVAAGFPQEDLRVLGPDPRKGNLVARYRGSGARPPLLLLAHLDVVEARREDWSFDPFVFFEQDGYFHGRGSTDDKAMAAIWVVNFIRMRDEDFTPDRDLVIALTADEEGGDHNGVLWLLENHRPLIDAAFCLNEGGGGAIRNGKYLSNNIQLSEKIYMTLELAVTNAGGHSSLPEKDNAIYRLAEGLSRLARYEFPVRLDEITRAYFERTAETESGPIGAAMRGVAALPPDPAAVSRLSEVPYYNALMRTTCVATMLEAGHAENALPQTASATVNCRLLPGDSADAVRRTLVEILADEAISITTSVDPISAPATPLDPEILEPVERLTEAMWPGIPVIPTMNTGATDGLYARNAGIPTYGVSGIFEDLDDNRAHGRDERIGVKQFFDGQEFLYRLVKTLASQSAQDGGEE